MTAVQSTPNIVGEKSAAYAERVVAWNVKMLLTARGESQAALARALGIQRSNMTSKMKGRVAWSLADVVKTAIFLDTTPESLLDDSLMKQFGVLTDTKKAGSEEPASHGLLRLGLNQRPSD